MGWSFVEGSTEKFEMTSNIPDVSMPFSWSMWMMETNATEIAIAHISSNTTSTKYIQFAHYYAAHATNSRFFIRNGSSQYTYVSSADDNPGTGIWTHLLGVAVSASDVRMHLNGGASGTPVQVGTYTDITPTHYSISGLVRSSGSNWYTGAHAHSAIWSGALTQDDARALAGGARPTDIATGTLLSWHPMDEQFKLRDMLGGQSFTEVGTPDLIEEPPVSPYIARLKLATFPEADEAAGTIAPVASYHRMLRRA